MLLFVKSDFMISVVIPTYNSEKTILKTLKGLKNQTYKDFEVIVVDDGSNDKTIEIIEDFKKEFNLKLIKQEHTGPAFARNLGAKNSRGEIILFTDADCIPDTNWVKEMIKPFENKETVGVSGTYETLNKGSIIARFEGYEIEKRHEKMKKAERIDFIGTYSAAYRKEIFEKFNGFDTSFPTASGEDPELSFRLAEAGYKMVFNPRAFVFHPHVDSLRNYLKQKFYRAYWRVLMYKKHRGKMLKDSYTGLEVPLSTIFLSLFVFSLFLSMFLQTHFLSTLFLILFFLVNLNTILFMTKKEKKMILFSPIMMLLRTVAWVLGFGIGNIKLRFK